MLDNILRKNYGFDFLEDSIIRGVDGNKLTIEKETMLGIKPYEVYMASPFGAMTLSNEPRKEEIICFVEGRKINPFDEFIGRRINGIDKKYLSIEDRISDLPWYVYISAEEYPVCMGISGGDYMITVDRVPSNRHFIGRISDIIQSGDYSDENIKFLKLAEKVLQIPVFDEQALREIPELHANIRG